jgi:hypothetical protein
VTVTAREQLGDAILNGTWYLDVNTGTVATPTWIPVNGIYDFKDGLDSKSIDVSDFSSDGWADNQNVGKSWSIELKVWRKRRAASVASDPGQEFIRLQNGESIQVRFYEMSGDGTTTTGDPRVEAYTGRGSVKWSPDGGKFDDGRSVSVTLTGKGKRTAITHPSPNA